MVLSSQFGVSLKVFSPNKNKEFYGGNQRQLEDYFNENFFYDEKYFEKRHRVPQYFYNNDNNRIKDSPFFVQRKDALKNRVLYPLQCNRSSLRILSLSFDADSVYYYWHISSSATPSGRR